MVVFNRTICFNLVATARTPYRGTFGIEQCLVWLDRNFRGL